MIRGVATFYMLIKMGSILFAADDSATSTTTNTRDRKDATYKAIKYIPDKAGFDFMTRIFADRRWEEDRKAGKIRSKESPVPEVEGGYPDTPRYRDQDNEASNILMNSSIIPQVNLQGAKDQLPSMKKKLNDCELAKNKAIFQQQKERKKADISLQLLVQPQIVSPQRQQEKKKRLAFR